MHDFDILVLGEINVDLILGPEARPVFGQVEKIVDDATLTVGGSGTIFACGAARLGLRVAYCGVVGDDAFGRFMLDALHARGVNTGAVIIDPTLKTGLSVILTTPGDRAILTHMGAIDALTPAHVPPALFAATRHVHVTSYFLQHRLRPGLPNLLRQARAAGATVSLDTNWDPAEQWDSGLAGVLALTDIFLPNEQEAIAIAACGDLPAALTTLAATVPTVSVKLGAAGAVCRQGATHVSDPGFAMNVVDTTGAGDSFNAGFLCGILSNRPLADALGLGCAAGALSTQAAGGVNAQPTLAAAQALIARRAQSA
jgi:sugar/nucleoside kinase (ribokinase family)